MDREKRLRRAGLLCCHFARNCAYYKASWHNNKSKAINEFWATVQNYFIDTSVLEWLKLFGNHSDKPHWGKIAKNPDAFKHNTLSHPALQKMP